MIPRNRRTELAGVAIEDTSLAPVRKKLPMDPLRKSNRELGLDSLDISL
jgi:hypothetical protein